MAIIYFSSAELVTQDENINNNRRRLNKPHCHVSEEQKVLANGCLRDSKLTNSPAKHKQAGAQTIPAARCPQPGLGSSHTPWAFLCSGTAHRRSLPVVSGSQLPMAAHRGYVQLGSSCAPGGFSRCYLSERDQKPPLVLCRSRVTLQGGL